MLQINNIDIPTPSDFQVGIMEIANAERNAKGQMLKDHIAFKRKLQLKYKYLESKKLAALLQLVNKNNFFVKYPDPETGKMETKSFYSGDKSLGVFDYNKGNPRWVDISFDLIEM